MSISTKRKWAYFFLAFLFFCVVLGGIIYKFYLPNIVARTLASEQIPAYVPTRIKTKIEKVKKPINETAKDVINTIHKSGITIEQIMKAIDDAKEEQAYAMLDELNKTTVTNVDQVFDMGKKYFPVDFDVEVFRDFYRKKATLPLIEKGILYANKYRNEKLINAETAKETVKKILLDKEDQFNRIVNKDGSP
jgi:hypothetical protein